MMNDRERVKKALACVQQVAELLAGLETPLPLGQVLAHLNGDAQLLRGLDRKLKLLPVTRPADRPLHCGECARALSPAEPVIWRKLRERQPGREWIGRPIRGHRRVFPVTTGSTCGDCTAIMHPEQLRPCRTCTRPIGGRGQPFCDEWCRWTYYNRRRKAQRAVAHPPTCVLCGKTFDASRRDARTCSPACRQAAHRQRILSG
jgi:predicted nucleic acid-binding Zn ribbon protein